MVRVNRTWSASTKSTAVVFPANPPSGYPLKKNEKIKKNGKKKGKYTFFTSEGYDTHISYGVLDWVIYMLAVDFHRILKARFH